MITAQRPTLTETESSQRQQEWVRDIKKHRDREREKEQRGKEEHSSFVPSAAATVIQECPLLLLCVWELNTQAQRHTHIHEHTLFEAQLRERDCVGSVQGERKRDQACICVCVCVFNTVICVYLSAAHMYRTEL